MRKREARAAVKRAAKRAGGWSALARQLKMSRQRVYAWPRVPTNEGVCLKVEKITGIPRHELRSDVYPLEVAG